MRFFTFLAVAIPASLPAATIRVPGEKATVQAAIDAAAAGDTVLVAAGEYAINAPITFRGKALTVRGEAGAGATVLRMSAPVDPNAASVVVFNSGETSAARLEGFTITGGDGMGLREASSGGGIYCLDSSPTLVDLRLSGNRAMAGGGLSCHGASAPRLIDCRITGNRAMFIGGGGIFCDEGSAPVLERAVITRNYGRHDGGALYCRGSSPTLTNCLLVENEGKDTGGGVYCASGSSPRLMNCTIERNRVAFGAEGISCAGSSPVVTNCIVTAIFADEASAAAVSYCLLRDAFPGTGNLTGDPRFACAGDYHLRPDSPAVGAGTPDGAPATDLEGRGRPCESTIDLGAYEHCLGAAAPVCFVRGNVDGDGSFDVSDAVSILGYLFLGGEEPACLDSADANDDGTVDLADGVSVLSHLFLGLPSPAPPFEGCGTDPTPDTLSCGSFPLCP